MFLFSKLTKKAYSVSEVVIVVFILMMILITITPLFFKKTDKEVLKEPVVEEENIIKEQISETDNSGCLIYKNDICKRCYPKYLLKDDICVLLKDLNCKKSKDGKTCSECLEGYENIDGECQQIIVKEDEITSEITGENPVSETDETVKEETEETMDNTIDQKTEIIN